MLYAVVPAKNEEDSICHILRILTWCGVDKILVVANGCIDNTLQRVYEFNDKKVQTIVFRHSLGVDIPRAIGSIFAKRHGASRVLFVDGDMKGEIAGHIQRLIQSSMATRFDVILSDCYPTQVPDFGMASEVIGFRAALNRSLGVHEQIGVASLSHGPSLISGKALDVIDLRFLAIPPLAMAALVKKGRAIGIGSRIRHERLGSPDRGKDHAQNIFETIIGDCLEALCFCKGIPRSREYKGRIYDGYQSQRRFDILETFIGESGNLCPKAVSNLSNSILRA